ncbi:MAG: TRAP transporter fused permease subunit [Proteobacteria bacterium]|nr:TRAP transporter fused permease subunit [Pseudomonadota bacterium]
MSGTRILPWVTSLIAVYHFFAVAQIPSFLGIFVPSNVHLAISISSAMVLVFLLLAANGERHGEDTEAAGRFRKVPWYDWLLMASGLTGAGFVIFFHEAILDYGEFGFLDARGVVLALMLAIPVLEAVRRTTGWALPIIILTFVFITVFQKFLPGLLYGQGFPIENLLYSAYVGDAGIFGLPLGIAANIVIIFLIFGALMEGAGASRWFMDMALALTGWSRGGPAKAAVVASAMFGSISGSPSGNSATTGVFTIPMMKRVGYTAAFAAAVEAVASTGGIILPPVMGAIAFIMAEWIETSYASIVLAAAVPALLYFLIVFVSVHLQARKDDIQPLPRSELPKFWPVFFKGWYYLTPIGVLVYFLVIKTFPPGIAASYTCLSVVVVSFFAGRDNWLTPSRLIKAFDEGVRRWITVASITAAVGIMIGALELSGVGIKVSRFIVDLAGGDLTMTLILVGLVSLIVGMGLDATPAYITLATLMAPALTQLGVPPIAAHLFVIYWGLASFYTPPTCIAVFVTSSIAGSKVWATGWEAVQIGIAAFLIPFAFVFNNGLLLRGSLDQILIGIGTAIIGACLLAGGTRGYMFGRINPIQRLILFGGGLLLIAPGITLPAIGLAAAAVALSPQLIAMRRSVTQRPQ